MALTRKDIESEETRNAKQDLDNHNAGELGNYTPGQSVTDAQNNYNNLVNNKPGDYQSKYGGAIDGLMDKILNTKDFSYDFNADPIYQQYKDQYTTLGKNAMMDTTSQASALSGGYANSYAATAGNQAYQGYLQQLNDVIPDLYAQAQDKYNTDLQNLYNQYSAVGNQEDREYSQYQNQYQNWQNDVANSLNAYDTLHDNDFSEYQQKESQWESMRDYLYNLYNGSMSNDQYVSDRNYEKERADAADRQWEQEYALQLAAKNKAAAGSSSGGSHKSSSSSASQPKKSGDASKYYNSALGYIHAGDGAVSSILAGYVNQGYITKKQANSMYEQIKSGKKSYTE